MGSRDKTSRPVLQIKDLRTYFFSGNRVNRAVDGVTLDVYRGRILGIVGESGSGKSVTASSILQLLPDLARIQSGEIVYHQNDAVVPLHAFARNGPEMRRIRGSEISMIFQDPMVSLNPVFSIGFQISEMLRLHSHMSKDEARTRSIELLAKMGIASPESRVDEYPHQFSGGMRQRAMIAMAMACNPQILIADEPTTALDVTVQAQVFELIRNLQESYGMATVLITHDMGVIAELADDVAVMYMGKVLETGPVQDVLASPKHPYTEALLESIPVLGRGRGQTLKPISGSTPDPYDRPPGCRFAPRCPYAMDVCSHEPPLTNVSESRRAACWLHDQSDHKEGTS